MSKSLIQDVVLSPYSAMIRWFWAIDSILPLPRFATLSKCTPLEISIEVRAGAVRYGIHMMHLSFQIGIR